MIHLRWVWDVLISLVKQARNLLQVPDVILDQM
jgi:hypothetical protein